MINVSLDLADYRELRAGGVFFIQLIWLFATFHDSTIKQLCAYKDSRVGKAFVWA